MPKFSYTAITETGTTITGDLDADSIEAARTILSTRGYIPAEVSELGAASTGGREGFLARLTPIKAPELILFTKQFRTMFRAGVPIVNLLQVLESQTENPKLRNILATMSKEIKEGTSLHDAFSRHPNAFPDLYCSMVRAGEASGALPDVLERLSYIIEHEHKIRADIKAALRYPMIVVCFLFVAFLILLTFVIPKFATIFLSAGIVLPLPTKVCIFLYEFLKTYWYFLIGGLAAMVIFFSYYLKTDQGKLTRDTVMMRIPVIGPLLIKTAMSRFASIFAILQASGVAVLDSMKILTDTINNAAIAREFDRLHHLLEEGRGISGPLKTARYFTPMVINMVAIGEESGNLDEMLREVSVHYDTEVEYAMGKLSEAIGPILMIGLAAMVGFFALAIFLPMWDLTKMVK